MDRSVTERKTLTSGSAYATSDRTQYAADTGYSGGSTTTNNNSISGISDPTLYHSERYGSCTYSAAVPNGDYLVTLYFAEYYHTSSGSSAFNVKMVSHWTLSSLAGGN